MMHSARLTILRGQSLFGYAGDVINEIAMNYHNMRWWITDKGLNMGAVIPARVHLSAFDELAGKLTLANWKDDGLSRDAFLEVAKELDKAGFRLKDELQPKPWKAIAQHNQKYSKNAIKSFEQAARNPRFARSVRRRLYIARKKVEGISTGQPEVSFGFDQDI
jgi:hypothetical protein